MPLLISCLMLSMWIGLRGDRSEKIQRFTVTVDEDCRRGYLPEDVISGYGGISFPYQGSSIFVSVRGSGR